MSDTAEPILIFTWGNPSRGDDAIGPRMYDLLIEQALSGVDVLTDFQLQIEHAVDLENRERILFIDASFSATEPYQFYRLQPVQDDSYTTHAMSPASLLATFEKVNNTPAPPAFMLSVRGYAFDLGKPLSDKARTNIEQAMMFIKNITVDKESQDWNVLLTG